MKRIEDRQIETYSLLMTGRINIAKMPILFKEFCRFNLIHIKIPMAFLTDTEQSILKFVWKNKRLLIEQSWERRTKLEATHILLQSIKQGYSI